jgi:hypothetical protein
MLGRLSYLEKHPLMLLAATHQYGKSQTQLNPDYKIPSHIAKASKAHCKAHLAMPEMMPG